jgi:hypothetical protein
VTRLVEGLIAWLFLRHLRADARLRGRIAELRPLVRRGIGPHCTLGARLVTCLVVVAIAAFRALVEDGRSREDAVTTVAEATHRLVLPWMPLLRGSSLVLGLSPLARMRRGFWLVNHLFPFNPPAWDHEHLSPDQGVGLDYSRCPVADSCRRMDAADLGSAAICALDHEFARAMRVTLARKHTLMDGEQRCTFRWVE